MDGRGARPVLEVFPPGLPRLVMDPQGGGAAGGSNVTHASPHRSDCPRSVGIQCQLLAGGWKARKCRAGPARSPLRRLTGSAGFRAAWRKSPRSNPHPVDLDRGRSGAPPASIPDPVPNAGVLLSIQPLSERLPPRSGADPPQRTRAADPTTSNSFPFRAAESTGAGFRRPPTPDRRGDAAQELPPFVLRGRNAASAMGRLSRYTIPPEMRNRAEPWNRIRSPLPEARPRFAGESPLPRGDGFPRQPPSRRFPQQD
jgi:hypothetical protein